MTEDELQKVFARLERVERSRGLWRVLACVLGLFFLLLGSFAVVATVDAWLHRRPAQTATGVTRPATMAVPKLGGGTTTRRGPTLPTRRMPRAEDP